MFINTRLSHKDRAILLASYNTAMEQTKDWPIVKEALAAAKAQLAYYDLMMLTKNNKITRVYAVPNRKPRGLD